MRAAKIVRARATEEQRLTAILELLYARWPDGCWAAVEPRGGFIHGRPTRTVRQEGRGVPDIVGCMEGFWVGVEVKAARGRLRESQTAYAVAIRDAGGYYMVARDPDEAEIALYMFLASIQKRRPQP